MKIIHYTIELFGVLPDAKLTIECSKEFLKENMSFAIDVLNTHGYSGSSMEIHRKEKIINVSKMSLVSHAEEEEPPF